MPFARLPDVDRCCVCVTDLKTAVAIIVVLGIVTSPVVSWAIIRHSYVIRVSCFVTTNAKRPDIVDINLNNILSFGFGANAGLAPSCLRSQLSSRRNATEEPMPSNLILRSDTDPASPKFVTVVKGIGWLVLIGDLVFIFCSLHLLVCLFKSPAEILTPIKIYMWALVVTSLMSFTYGLLFIIICVAVGGALPLFELFFALFDLSLWLYFLIVVNSYRRRVSQGQGLAMTNAASSVGPLRPMSS